MPGPAEDFIVPTVYAPYGLVPVGAPVPVTTEAIQMLTGPFANDHASQAAILRITDGNDQPITPDVEIPPKSPWVLETQLSRFTGLKWGVTGGLLYGGLNGYPVV